MSEDKETIPGYTIPLQALGAEFWVAMNWCIAAWGSEEYCKGVYRGMAIMSDKPIEGYVQIVNGAEIVARIKGKG